MRLPGSSPLGLPAACALSAAAFVAYALALPGFGLPLAPVALVPLIVALRGQAPRRAVGIAMAGGFVGMCVGFHWILGMLRVFAGLPPAVAALATGLLCAYQTGRFGLWAWLAWISTALH